MAAAEGSTKSDLKDESWFLNYNEEMFELMIMLLNLGPDESSQ